MAKATVGSKNKQAAAIKEQEVLTAVNGLTLDSVSGDIAATQVEVQKSLADLSSKLTERLQILRNIESAIELKEQSLKQLYEIERTATALDDLKAEIDNQRKAWQEEQGQEERQSREKVSERKKLWQREEEEYDYKLAQEQKKVQDGFADRMATLEKENKGRQEGLEKNWSEREGELKKRETELADLKKQVENFPEMVKKEVNAAVAIATNSLKKEYETKIVLQTKDAETAQKLAAQEIASLNQAILKFQAQVDGLKEQLEQAHHDVKEISAKALDSASGRSAMEALQKVLEKEQTYKPSK
jgi:hypothetical protein